MKDHTEKIFLDTRQISSSGIQYENLGRNLEEISQDLKTQIEMEVAPQRMIGLIGFHFEMNIQFLKNR